MALGVNARGFSFVPERLNGRLRLRCPAQPELGLFEIDWTSAEYRRRIAGGRRQLLPRAVGLAKKADLKIVDATGGLGRDAVTMAALGAEVTVLERNPALVQLLQDAQRAASESEDAVIRSAAARIRLVEADAIDWLAQEYLRADVIHLDPMYPEDGKTALPQKAMQWLRLLSGSDPDADRLLSTALAAPVRRVVVKRALKAPWLLDRKPSLEFTGTQARYDVYLNPTAVPTQ